MRPVPATWSFRENISPTAWSVTLDGKHTAIGTRNPNRPSSIILKVGTFDDPSIFKADIAIFTIDKQKFHYIEDGMKSFERKP